MNNLRQHQKHQKQQKHQHQNSNVDAKNQFSTRKFFQKRHQHQGWGHPEYHFDGVNCTVNRNPADGRKRVRCDMLEEWDINYNCHIKLV